LITYHPTICMYVSKNVGIRGYFSKPKGVREQKRLGNPAIDSYSQFTCTFMCYCCLTITPLCKHNGILQKHCRKGSYL